MKRARGVLVGPVLLLLVACGGATFENSPGDGGEGEGGGSSTSSSSGAASGSGGSSGTTSSSGGSSSSGSTSSSGAGSSSGSGSSSGAGSGSGGSSDSGAGSSPCPLAVPTSGAACTPSGLACEFGDADVQGCDTVATCGAMGWQVQAPTLTDCGSVRPTGCPATRALVPTGSTCSPNALICDYVEGRCECSEGAGGVIRVLDGSIVSTWICQSPDTAAGCPARRPSLGSPCSTEGLSCDYGSCAIEGGTTEQCTSGLWVPSSSICPG